MPILSQVVYEIGVKGPSPKASHYLNAERKGNIAQSVHVFFG